MFELIDPCPALAVQESEYKRLLGYPPHYTLEERSRKLAESARQWYAEHGRPWIYARETEARRVAGFSSRQLHDQFRDAEVHGAMLAVVSAGPQCEEKARQLWEEGKPDEYFFMEMYGSAVVEHLITLASGRICAQADQDGMVALPHYSPGYSGWDVADQVKLWKLIQQQKTNELPGDLEVMETGMLRPKKSLLAVIGLTRHLDKATAFAKLVPCENCSLPGCQFRRAPYQHSLPQVEDVRRLQAGAYDYSPPKNLSASGLNHNADYSINLKALRKWSRERLQLIPAQDGSFEARFRYEGTTCSNMGRPIEIDYRIRLGPAAGGYKILDPLCSPAPGDVGHTFQCEYLKDADSFMRNIADEKPLLGQPLENVLGWERSRTPSGCYCDVDRRSHKWGLVYEVIHYALVQREKGTTSIDNPAPLAKLETSI
ncbi:MAG TPA: hypothetical protein VFC44_24230 [Candidatus Saccharimonadales bacterium]|nr:hypothetical protein [Candidatus Saccharimonadales bacterium]